MARQAEVFRSLGFALVDWIEHYLVHGPGDVEGQPIEMDDEFAAFVVKAYQVDARTGRRFKRRVAISRPKGRAKSELAGFLAAAEALAPVRFDHWAEPGEMSAWGYEYEPDEPVGRQVKRPGIRCFSTELGQAGNTYDVIRYVLDPETCSAALRRDYGRIDVGLSRILLPGGRGETTPESAADTSKDGGRETFAVFDETHLWLLPRIKSLHQTVNRNLLKRKVAEPWSLETTTMFAPGEDSVAEGTFAYAQSVAEGRAKDDLLLFDHREAPAKYVVTNRRDRIAGLREVYGPAAAWMDLPAIAASYDDPQVSDAQWQRYWFNRPVSLQGNWLDQMLWDGALDQRATEPGARVVLALDGSFNGDCTALVRVELGERLHVTVAGLWERPAGARDWEVPILDVEAAISAECLAYQVAEVAADPFRWARSLQVLEGDGVPVQEFPQSASRMTPATANVTDLLATGGMTHDGDARLTRHVSNAVLKIDARGQRIYKEHKHSDRKIDLAVCMVMGLERASWHRANATVDAVNLW